LQQPNQLAADFFNTIGAKQPFARTTTPAKRQHGTLASSTELHTGPRKRFFRPPSV